MLDSYLYSATYYREYGVVPEYGERPHGDAGIIETYKERYQVSDEETLFSLLSYSAGMICYRGHLPCPCGSGKRMRNCHGQIILSALNSKYAAFLSWEAKYLIEQRRRGNKVFLGFQSRKALIYRCFPGFLFFVATNRLHPGRFL